MAPWSQSRSVLRVGPWSLQAGQHDPEPADEHAHELPEFDQPAVGRQVGVTAHHTRAVDVAKTEGADERPHQELRLHQRLQGWMQGRLCHCKIIIINKIFLSISAEYASVATITVMSIDIAALRAQFPIFGQRIDGNPLVYLDTAATAQKPQAMLEAMTTFSATANANVNRGVHPLAEQATVAFDAARKCVAQFVGAKHAHEIIFTKNCTEAINLVARTLGTTLQKGDCIVLSVLEHHSNIVPWLQLQEERGITLEWIDIDDHGKLRLEQLQKALQHKHVKLVAITGLSNVLGTRTPLGEVVDMAHMHGAQVLVDAAQLIVHEPIHVQALDIDFLAFSGHKLYGPTGIGVLYGKQELLKKLPPFLGGGDMIRSVTRTGFTTAELPRKFEAGTPPIAEAIGLQAAIDWLQSYDRATLQAHEQALVLHAMQKLQDVDGVEILGTKDAATTHGCISFTLKHVHPHDLTEILGRKGICLRAGHHCTQPLHKHLGIPASARLSVGVYNTMHDIDACIRAIQEAQRILHA